MDAEFIIIIYLFIQSINLLNNDYSTAKDYLLLIREYGRTLLIRTNRRITRSSKTRVR